MGHFAGADKDADAEVGGTGRWADAASCLTGHDAGTCAAVDVV